jgi:hypothetical protein
MSKLELFILQYTGYIVTAMGFCGAIVTIMFDEIAGRVGHGADFGPMQIAGVIVFLVTMLFGVIVTKFLSQVRELLDTYLNR